MPVPRRRQKKREPNTDTAASVVRHEDIERRAYDLYAERGRGSGRDWDDWFRAERELKHPKAGAIDAGS